MTLEVFDYRDVPRNPLVTPEIRVNFMKMEPGSTSGRGHTHDLGHEIVLLLEAALVSGGAGAARVRPPAELGVWRAGGPPSGGVVGDEPAYIYLSVTPHVAPTHTLYDDQGNRRSPKYDTVQQGWEPAPATP